MFHWICPECGREIAPTVRECPACDPSAVVAEPALVGVVEAPTARALNIEAPTARALNIEAPTAQALPAEAPLAQALNIEAPKARALDVKAPAARPLSVEPLSGTPLEAALNLPAPVEPSWKTGAVEGGPPESLLAELLPQLGEGPSSDRLADLPSLLDPPAEATEPPQVQQTFRLAVRAVPPALQALIAELGPAADRPRDPVGELCQPTPSQELLEPPLVTESFALPLGSVRTSAKLVGARLLALSPPAVRPAEPQTPSLGLAPALAPLAHYSPLEGRPMRPAVPAPDVLKNQCVPRVTLPGPMLTGPLARFQDRELNPIPTNVRGLLKKRLIPGWLASVLIVGTILAAGFNSVFSIVPRALSETKARPVGAVEAAESPVPEAPAAASPLSRAIEVTGFRIQVDPGKKSEIRYLVVNHTASRFAGVTVYVTLRTAGAQAGQAPLGRFQFAAPNLGAFESKEMSSAIERVTRPITLPEWQDVRADVEIGQ